MISVITEDRNKDKLKQWRSLGYKINIDVANETLMQSEESYKKIIQQANYSLILNRRTQAVIFYVANFYQNTLDLIKFTLFKRKPVIVVLESGDRYDLKIKEDLFQESYGQPALASLFKEVREQYYEAKELTKAKEQYQLHVNIDIEAEETHKLINTFLYLYELESFIDWNSPISIADTYNQIKYYLDNDIPYAREVQGILPEESPFAEYFHIDTEDIQYKGYEEESYGDIDYFDAVALEGELV